MKTDQNKQNKTFARTAGFFLIEATITLLIASTLLFVFMSALSRSLEGVKRTRQFTSSAALAREQMLLLINELHMASDIEEKSGTTEMGGYIYQWEVNLEDLEETENKLSILTLKIFRKNHVITEITTIVSPDR